MDNTETSTIFTKPLTIMLFVAVIAVGITGYFIGLNSRVSPISNTNVAPTITPKSIFSGVTQDFTDARNTQRQSDVREILSAITQYVSESGKSYSMLATIPTCTIDINQSAIIGTDGIDLEAELVPIYIVSIPLDPNSGTSANTGYRICTTGGRIQISAHDAEGGKVISVKR